MVKPFCNAWQINILSNGADFYQLPRNTEQITLTKTTWRIPDEVPFLESGLVPLWAGQEMKWQIV
jgi:dihydroorotase